MKRFDDEFRINGINLIAGVDEAGRGPLAGPVVAAAVILPPDYNNFQINDSKKLTKAKRNLLFEEIKKHALSFAYEVVSREVIDEINILKATLLGMERSVGNLSIVPDIILIDGNRSFKSELNIRTIVKGDQKSLSIAAASIIAKVIRDEIMVRLDSLYPQYDWKSNKGYPTKRHIESIGKFGITDLHRKTFLKKIKTGGE
ncbi:MAG: ribonuclease HII [Ignavibacteriaceae bacterium]